MRGLALSTSQPRRPWITTQASADHVADDHVRRGFGSAALDQIWLAHATYLAASDGVLYLAVVMDSALRRMLGWVMSIQQTADLMYDAVREALQHRPGRSRPVIPDMSVPDQKIVVHGSNVYFAGDHFTDEDGDPLLVNAESNDKAVVNVR